MSDPTRTVSNGAGMPPRAPQGLAGRWKAGGLLAALALLGAATPLHSTDLKLAGNLTRPNGTPMTGTADLSLVLTGVTPTCDAGVVTVTLGPEGYFELPLTGCAAVLKSGTGVGATLTVNGAVFPRQPLLVPYALQVNHSVQADEVQRFDHYQADADAGSLQSVLRGKALGTVYAVREDGGLMQYSTRGTYCGAAGTDGGGTLAAGRYRGYAASKLLCEAACSDGKAHMCTTDDVVRSEALGYAMQDGLYSTGVVWSDTEFGGGEISDCGGWKDVAAFGPYWSAASGPKTFNCGVPAAVLCCR